MKKKKTIATALLALSLLIGATACGSSGETAKTTKAAEGSAAVSEAAGSQAAGSEAAGDVKFRPHVKIGVVGANNEQWKPVIENMKKKGCEVELVQFTDYVVPNQALSEGDIDLNAFQHKAFLENWNKENNGDLVSIGDTLIAPLSLYSKKWKSLDEIPDNAKIAIPNDATNGGRALKVLEQGGLLKIDPKVGWNAQKKDIIENPKNIEIVEVEASQTAALLPDVDAAIINGAHAVDNGLNPEKDALLVENWKSNEERGNPYVNVIAARAKDAKDPTYLEIVKQYQTPEVAEIIKTVYKGAYIPAFD